MIDKFDLLALLRFINCNKKDGYDKQRCKRVSLAHKQVLPADFISIPEYSKYISGHKKLTHNKVSDFHVQAEAFVINIINALRNQHNFLVFIKEMQGAIRLPQRLKNEIELYTVSKCKQSSQVNDCKPDKDALKLMINIFCTACDYSSGKDIYKPVDNNWKSKLLTEIESYSDGYIEVDRRDEQIFITSCSNYKKRSIRRELVLTNPSDKPFQYEYIRKINIDNELRFYGTDKLTASQIEQILDKRFSDFYYSASFVKNTFACSQSKSINQLMDYYYDIEAKKIIVKLKFFNCLSEDTCYLTYQFDSIEPFDLFNNSFIFRATYPTMTIDHRHTLVYAEQLSSKSDCNNKWRIKYTPFFRSAEKTEKSAIGAFNSQAIVRNNKLEVRIMSLVLPGEGYYSMFMPMRATDAINK